MDDLLWIAAIFGLAALALGLVRLLGDPDKEFGA